MNMSIIGQAVASLFKGTVLLLKGQGTNNATNNTFVDSSSNNFTVTRAGNTPQGAFSPFSTESGYWSNSFNGTSSRLTVPNNTAFDQTGAWTVEMWIYRVKSGANQYFYTQSTNGFAQLTINSSNFLQIDSSGVGVKATSTSTIPANTWTHVAMVATGTQISLFVNGVQQGASAAFTGVNSAKAITIGSYDSPSLYFGGYISNVRVVKGTALYTGTFTPSTTPLTAIAGTSLLTCQGNRFVDSSTNNFSVTSVGAAVVPFSAFSKAEYSTAMAGSAYFDGSGDYLTVADAPALRPDAADFTIEAWIYPTANNAGTYYAWIGKMPNNNYGAFYFPQRNMNMYIYLSYAGTGWDIHGVTDGYTCGTMVLNAWNHIAITRSGATVRGFLNGVLGSTITLASAGQTLVAQAQPVSLGAQSGGAEPAQGYISNFRYVKGTALYTSSFTPPSAPVSAVSGTSLLMNATNGAIFDSSGTADFETAGTAKISTDTAKYGTSSMKFNGTTDYLLAPAMDEYTFGLEDFTVEGWFNINAISGSRVIVSARTSGSSNDRWSVYVGSNSKLNVDSGSATIITGSATVSTATWNYFVFQRRNGVFYTYLNGVQDATNATSYNLTSKVPLGIGVNPNFTGYWNGYLQDIRITKGTGIYTGTFTPPNS